jgi:hypothetical protein
MRKPENRESTVAEITVTESARCNKGVNTEGTVGLCLVMLGRGE